MKTLTPFLVIGSLFALTACPDGELTDNTDETDTVDCDPDTTFPTEGALSAGSYDGCNPYAGETVLSYFPKPSCAADEWEAKIETKGWGGGGVAYIHDSAGGGAQANWWGEEHDLTQGASNPDSWWDAYTLTLPVVATVGEQQDNVNTIHKCAANDGTTLVWGYEVFAYETTTTTDCVIISESETTDGYVSAFTTEFSNMSGCDVIQGWTAE